MGRIMGDRTENGGRAAAIEVVPYARADQDLKDVYERYGGDRRPMDHILAVHSLNPPSLVHHRELYVHLMRGPGPLTRRQREMIAVVVSAENDCFY